MHAIQVLPVLAWLLSFARLSERRRLGLVWAATAGYGALVTVSVAQTAAGRAPTRQRLLQLLEQFGESETR